MLRKYTPPGSTIPWQITRVVAKDRLRYHQYDTEDIGDMAVTPAELSSFYEKREMIANKKAFVFPRDASRDRMKEMRALERKQRVNRCRKAVKKNAAGKRTVVKRRR